MLLWGLVLGLKLALGREDALKDMLLDRKELTTTSSFSHRGRHRALPPSDSDLAILYKSYLEEPTTADTINSTSTPTNSTRRRIAAIVGNWQTCLPGDTCSGGYVCCVAPADTTKTTCRPSDDCKTTGVSCSNKVVVSVGRSGGNSKTVTASTSVTCPATVSKYNWLGGYTWPDTFAVTTSGSQVSVRRTDSTSGWGMDLRFECCPAASSVIPQWGTCSPSDTCVSGTVCCVAPADTTKTTCRPSWDCKTTGSSTIRCGSDWTNANSRCGTACSSDANCPSGQRCFRDLSLTPCGGGNTVAPPTSPPCTEVEVRVGSSGGNSKTVTASTSVTCPATVSRANWLGGYTWPDMFAVTTSGSQVSVRRTDSTSGWGMDLRFKCCQDGTTPPPGPGPSATVQRLLEFLRSVPDGQIITGQHNKEGPPSRWTAQVYDWTGQYPGLWGGELGFNPWDVADRAKVIDQAITEWSHKSLVALTWHACPPHLSSCYYDDIWYHNFLSDSEWTELTTEGTARNNDWKARLDEIVPHLQRLKDAGVPVLFRPFHESNMDWSWWQGRAGPSGIRKLWIFTRNYLTVQKGLTNLAWVWNLQDNWSDNLPAHVQSYYPGDAYVDIVSVDFWGSQQPTWEWYQAMLDLARPGNKPLVLGEVGQIPTVASLQAQPKWKYFMLWSEYLDIWNTPDSVRAAYGNSRYWKQSNINI
eukprot:g58617.t1